MIQGAVHLAGCAVTAEKGTGARVRAARRGVTGRQKMGRGGDGAAEGGRGARGAKAPNESCKRDEVKQSTGTIGLLPAGGRRRPELSLQPGVVARPPRPGPWQRPAAWHPPRRGHCAAGPVGAAAAASQVWVSPGSGQAAINAFCSLQAPHRLCLVCKERQGWMPAGFPRPLAPSLLQPPPTHPLPPSLLGGSLWKRRERWR